MKTGPNEARPVVWPTGEYFLILLNVFIAHIVSNDELHDRESRDDENGPEQSQTRRLAHR